MKKIVLISVLLIGSNIASSQNPAIQWQKSLGGTVADGAKSIKLTTDGGYIVSGWSYSNDGDFTTNYGLTDCWVVKLDNLGTIQWKKSLGGSDYDHGWDVNQTADGGYIVIAGSVSNDGDVSGNHGYGDYWVVKLDNFGAIQWQKSYGGSENDFAYSIQQTADEGYIVAGYTESNNGNVIGNHGGADYWIVKLDNSGNIQWQKTLGGTQNDYGRCIQQTIDGGYIIAGNANSNDVDVTDNRGLADYWIVKLDNSGNIQWQKTLGGTQNDYGWFIQQTADGGYIVAGGSGSSDGDLSGSHIAGDFWIVKLNPTVGIEENSTKNPITIFPNPSNSHFYFSGLEKGNQIEVYNLTGRIILQTVSENSNCTIDFSNKENVIYFYKVIGDNFSSGKLIKQ
ncbi:MAG: T9SS type A sorting domain-containing protein [Bacteroidota bacterium]